MRNDDNKNVKKPSMAVIVLLWISGAFFILIGILMLITGTVDGMIYSILIGGGFIIGAYFYRNNGTSSYKALKSNGELFDGFIRDEDEMTGSVTYRHPKVPKNYSIGGSGLIFDVSFSSIGIKYNVFFRCCYKYTGSYRSGSMEEITFGRAKWFFLEEILFKTDNNRYKIKISPKRDNRNANYGNSLHEYIECGGLFLETSSDINMFSDLAKSNVVKVRLIGKEEQKDFDFSDLKSRRFIIDGYNAYEKAIATTPELIMIPEK